MVLWTATLLVIEKRSPVTDRSQYMIIAALAVIVVLTVGLLTVYTTTNNEIVNLKQTLKEVCNESQLAASNSNLLAVNLSATWYSQIRSDKTIISILNSTRPAGYQNLITLINAQISQDNSTMRLIDTQARSTVLPPFTSMPELCSAP